MYIDQSHGTHRRQPARHPTVTTAAGRDLSCYPASVFAFIVDSWDRFLLLRQPGQTGWEVISRALQPGENVPAAVLSGVDEKAGPQFRAIYLGVLDTFTFLFDANLPPVISICCLLRHRGGDLHPGKDVREAEFRWWELSDLEQIDLAAPKARWDLLTRAVDMSRYLRDVRGPEEEDRSSALEFP